MASLLYLNYIIYETIFSKIQAFISFYLLEFLLGVCTNTLNVCICTQMKKSSSLIF